MTAEQFEVWNGIARRLGFESTSGACVRYAPETDDLVVRFRFNNNTRSHGIDQLALTAAWGDQALTQEIICDARSAIIKELSDG